MSPHLEIVGIQEQESFKIWKHGYPYETVRWHFHPEYELNYITHTSGRFYVGDHTGIFAPGQLVMTGPNLPHNWISDVPKEQHVPERCLVLQFSGKCVMGGIEAFPELRQIQRLLADAQRGVLFSAATTAKAAPVLNGLLHSRGFQRVHQFLHLLEILCVAQDHTMLATAEFRPNPQSYMSTTINQVLAYLAEHLDEPVSESDLARYAGMESTAFSRFFRRQTDLPFVQFLIRLRINRACELLISSNQSITEICYACGFNNVSNFNRLFLAHKGIPPSRFRRYYRQNAECEALG